MEYCRHGCLRDYLVNQRQHFQDTMENVQKPAFKRRRLVSFQPKSSCEPDDEDSDDCVVLTTKDLVCYAYQIARGMEFLASRKVSTTLVAFYDG